MARNNEKSALHQCLDHMPEYLISAGFRDNTAVLQDSVDLVKLWCTNRKLVRCKEAVVAAAISVACIKNHIHCVSRELAKKLNADVAQVNRFMKKLKVLSNITEDPLYYASMARTYAEEAANNLNMDSCLAFDIVHATTELVQKVISAMKARELKSVVAACFFSCAYEKGRPVMKKEICAAMNIAEPTVTAACRQLETVKYQIKQNEFFMGFNDYDGNNLNCDSSSGLSGLHCVSIEPSLSCVSNITALTSAEPSCVSGPADSTFSCQHTVNEVPAAVYEEVVKECTMVDEIFNHLACSAPEFGHHGTTSSVHMGGGNVELGDSTDVIDVWDHVQAALVQ